MFFTGNKNNPTPSIKWLRPCNQRGTTQDEGCIPPHVLKLGVFTTLCDELVLGST